MFIERSNNQPVKKFAFLAGLVFMGLQLYAQNTQVTFLTVYRDGSGNFKTIQEAINSVRDLSQQRVTIHIKNGLYREKLVIPTWKTNIALVGESAERTIITNNDYTGKDINGRDASGRDKYMTFTSYTVLVQGNDFSAENLTIQNKAGRVGQAVALHVEGDWAILKNCRILGNQDTLYAATGNSRQFYKDCYIEGTTDFIFGEATVVFQNCVVKSLANSYITAAATTVRQQYGFVFFDCKLVTDTAARKVYLGRPWRPYAKTVFIRCELGNHIVPEGWNPWKGDAMFPDKEKTALFAEYNNTGAGAVINNRLKWSRQLTKHEAKKYTIKNIFSGDDKWNPLY